MLPPVFPNTPRTGGGTHHLQEETTERPSWFLSQLIFSESRSSLAGTACSEISVGVAYSVKNHNMKTPERTALKNKWIAFKLKSVCQSMNKHTRLRLLLDSNVGHLQSVFKYKKEMHTQL